MALITPKTTTNIVIRFEATGCSVIHLMMLFIFCLLRCGWSGRNLISNVAQLHALLDRRQRCGNQPGLRRQRVDFDVGRFPVHMDQLGWNNA